MTTSKTFSILLLVIIFALLHSSLYTVMQSQEGMILRLGRILTDKDGKAFVAEPGLHFKMPFIDDEIKFDMRLQTDAAKSSRIYIQNENYLMVDYYVKWRIADLPLFYTAVGTEPQRAETLIEQKIDNELRNQFGTRSLQSVVQQDRNNIVDLLKAQASESVRNLGVNVVDVRLKAIDLPPSVRQFVFNSMRADRQRIANSYRADGESQAMVKKAAADAERITIIADAQRQVNEQLAKGLATAAKIYAAAYSQDDKFYAFYQSLQAYRGAFARKNNVMVLRPEGAFFKYFNPGSANNTDTFHH